MLHVHIKPKIKYSQPSWHTQQQRTDFSFLQSEHISKTHLRNQFYSYQVDLEITIVYMHMRISAV